ncbi:uncharacterized protein LOC119396126 [Rhipicephalus sanguineus]|uniref:uncharacterized protein LOC119396126 n=1 Tax=Rhipicephalus sanguineus TaxID=34632 RepID=UPI001893E2CF|nr:uncharacterized protein LOC119396126 [Rhipicephalus sanguineus]
MDGSRYSGVYNSRFPVGTPTLPIVTVPKITDLSKSIGGPGGAPFTITGVANERPTNPSYVSAFNGGFNVDSRKTEPEVNSAYKYFPRTIISSSETRKTDSDEPEKRIGFTNFEIGRRPLKWLSRQRGAPVHKGFTANGWETPSIDSSGNEASTTRTSATANGVGDSTYKPDYTSASEIVGTRRRFLNMPRFQQPTKPSGRFLAAGGVAYPGNTGGYSLHVPETLPSSLNNGYTGPARNVGSRTYNPIRNFRDIAGDEVNRAINDLRRQSAPAKTPEFERGYLSVSRMQPKFTNEYEFIPYNRPSRNIIPSANSPSDRASTIFDAANRLNDSPGPQNMEAGGGWKAGLTNDPISSRAFTVGGTSDILPGTGSYSSPTVGRRQSVLIGGSDGSPNAETTMNAILDGRLRGSMSSYPSKYQSSEGTWVPYFRKDNSGSRSTDIGGFVGGRDGGRGNTDDTRFLVTTGYRALPTGAGANAGYTTNTPLYRSDGSYGYISQSNSPSHSSGYSGTIDNSGNKGYQPFLLPRSASVPPVSSQENRALNPRGAWQGMSSYPVSATN